MNAVIKPIRSEASNSASRRAGEALALFQPGIKQIQILWMEISGASEKILLLVAQTAQPPQT
jgi:hypothetical protein